MLIPNPDLLVAEAFTWVAQRAQLRPCPREIDPADKYILRSSLQKSVRRGLTERAVANALALHRIDPAYSWRAIHTIALEDLGFGGPDIVLWAVAAQGSSFRRNVGEVPLLIALVTEMSRALKSRSAVELAFSVDTADTTSFTRFGTMSTTQLLTYVAADNEHETYLALSVLRGITPRGLCKRPPDQRGILAACEIMHGQLPANLARVTALALARPLDNMAIGLFPSWRMAQSVDEIEIVEDVMPDSQMLSGYGSYAYDQHERLGKQAIRAFAGDLSRLHLGFGRMTYGAVADAVFVEEGQCLDRWAAGGALTRLREEADGYSLTRHRLTQSQASELRQMVRDNIPLLNDHRARLLNATQSRV